MEHSPIINRFLGYVRIDTQSRKTSEKLSPTTPGQFELAQMIKNELMALGIAEMAITPYHDGSFIVFLPATPGYETQPHLVFAAHLDTSPDSPGSVTPIVHRRYQSGDLVLPNGGTIIKASELQPFIGKTIITSSGDSLLGGDDKAGVSAMVTVLESLQSGIPHGPLTFWFCVNEEIGQLNISVIPEEIVRSWNILWTIDGERVGLVDTGCYHGQSVKATFSGKMFHPGLYGDKMIPAHYAAVTLMGKLNDSQPRPWKTTAEGSYIYVRSVHGDATTAVLDIIPRSFDKGESDQLVEMIRKLAFKCTDKWKAEVIVETETQYVTTKTAIDRHPNLVQVGMAAHQKVGFPAERNNVKGGTDGGMINVDYPDLPAPNMGTGGHNHHSREEFLVMEELELVPNIITQMIRGYATFQS